MKGSENKITTRIWLEEPSAGNPFLAVKSYCHGYDYYGELLGGVFWDELLFLHLRGELPTETERDHFNILLCSVANTGPRELPNRAAMSAALGGVPVGSALSAGLASSMGAYSGGAAVERVMRMLIKVRCRIQKRGIKRLEGYSEKLKAAGLPGYGLFYGETDGRARLLHDLLIGRKDFKRGFLRLYGEIEKCICEDGTGMLLHGVFAASLLDLGFLPKQGHGLYMIAGTAGMLAHLCETYGKNWRDYPNWYTSGSYEYSPREGKEENE